MTVRQLTKTIPSDFEGNPLLYITRNRKGEVYVNNAWINQTESTEIVTQENKRQVNESKKKNKNIKLLN